MKHTTVSLVISKRELLALVQSFPPGQSEDATLVLFGPTHGKQGQHPMLHTHDLKACNSLAGGTLGIVSMLPYTRNPQA